MPERNLISDKKMVELVGECFEAMKASRSGSKKALKYCKKHEPYLKR